MPRERTRDLFELQSQMGEQGADVRAASSSELCGEASALRQSFGFRLGHLLLINTIFHEQNVAHYLSK